MTNLRELFLNHQRVLTAALRAGKESLPHPGAKGDDSELNWANLLAKHLPTRYQVTPKAFVVDADGNTSDQVDLVIHDRQYSTLLFNAPGGVMVPAESVYAVLEVKQNLSKTSLRYAGLKARSVRRLRRTSSTIRHAGGRYKPKKPFKVLAGIVALESSWSPAFGGPLKRQLVGMPKVEALDFGCAIAEGAFARTPVRRSVIVSPKQTALVFFYLTLLERLQALGTVPAIDFGAYRRAIEK